MLCFSNDNILEKEIEDSGNLYEGGFLKLRMWHQYGDRHRGICLGLDKDKIVQEFNKIKAEKKYRSTVKYTNSTRNIFNSSHFYANDFIETDFRKFFVNKHVRHYRETIYFTKASDWKDENEFRFVVITDGNPKDEFIFIDIQNHLNIFS